MFYIVLFAMQGERGYWTVNYTSTQNFMNNFGLKKLSTFYSILIGCFKIAVTKLGEYMGL